MWFFYLWIFVCFSLGISAIVFPKRILIWWMAPRKIWNRYPQSFKPKYFYDEERKMFYAPAQESLMRPYSKLGFLLDEKRKIVYITPAWIQIWGLRLSGILVVLGCLFVIIYINLI